MTTSKPWPTSPVYKCNVCGREAGVNSLTYDENEGTYWCSTGDSEGVYMCAEDHNLDCPEGQMKWSRDEPAEFISIGLYETHRVYGGPEEGGWYYDAGVLVHSTLRNFIPEHWGTDDKDAGHAQWYYNVLQGMAQERNEDARKNGTEFRYHVNLYTNQSVPAFFPATRPRYS